MASISSRRARAAVLHALLTLVAGVLLATAPAASAGVFDRDTTFGTSGLIASADDHGSRWKVLSVLPDGRFLAAGQTTGDRAAVARFTAAGQLDQTFAADAAVPGVAIVPGQADGSVPAGLVVLADGRIVLGATTRATPYGIASLLIARLTADGHLDPGFGTGGVYTTRFGGQGTQMGGIAAGPGGTIVAVGRAPGTVDFGVVLRVTAAGEPDETYGERGSTATTFAGAGTGFNSVKVDGAGRIYVAGGVFAGPLRQRVLVARFTAAGQLDAGYGVSGAGYTATDVAGPDPAITDAEGRRMHLGDDGRVLVAATTRSTTGPTTHLVALVRLTATGALDTTFSPSGTPAGTRTQDISPSHVTDLNDLVMQPDGGFVIAGRMDVGFTTQMALAGYHADGSADTSLNPGNATGANAANLAVGDVGSDQAGAVALTAGGNLLVAGTIVSTTPARGAILRLGGDASAPHGAISASWPQAVPGRVIRPGQTVTFDASASNDADGHIVSYDWDLDGDGTTDHTGPTATKTYTQAGYVGVLLRVTDEDGLVGTSGATLQVQADLPPVASFTNPGTPPVAGKAFTVGAAAVDPDGSVVKYEWDLDGNGSYETGTGSTAHATATFGHDGPAKIGVRVTDDEGSTGVEQETLTVAQAPCIQNPVIKIGRARIVTQGTSQAGAGCFHGVTTQGGGYRITEYTTDGHFRVNGIYVDTVGTSKAVLTWKRKLTSKSGPKGTIYTEGETTVAQLIAPKVHVEATSKGGVDLAFHDGAISWGLSGNLIWGFHADADAGIAGLPLKIVGQPEMQTDGSSTLDILPGTPPELLGKTPSKPQHLTFGPTASAAAAGAFSFDVDKIPLGVITLGPVHISFDGAGTWNIQAEAEIPYPIPTKVKGKLVIVAGKVKSLDLELQGALPTPTPIIITSLGLHLDFGPKVAANPDCIKTVGLVETTPYDTYKALDYYLPQLRPLVLSHPELDWGGLFHKTFLNYPVPKFALCGHIGLSVAELLDGDVKFGFARYADPYPNLFFFQGKVTVAKLLEATVAAEFTTEGYVHLSAAVEGGYPKGNSPWVKWSLGFDFEYFKKQFNAQAHAMITVVPLDFTTGANLLVSSKGIAACLYFKTFLGTWRPGAGAKWGHGPTLYFFGCDVADYKVVIKHALSGDVVIGDVTPVAHAARSGGLPVVDRVPDSGHGNDAGLMKLAGTKPSAAALRSVRAHAAQAAPDAITVPAGLPGTVMGFVGAGAPPHVILHGPKGETLDTGSGNAAVEGTGFAALKNAATSVTEVVIAHPSGGRWTVELAADSSRLVQAIQAGGTRAPKVTGRVEGSGQDRRLRYAVSGLPAGSKIAFVESGRGGGGNIGAVDASGSGTLPFHPAAGAPGKREIQAIITAPDGYLSARMVLGSYTAPRPPRPARATKLTVKRSGSRLTLRWRGGRFAARQQVDIHSSTGLEITRIVRGSTTWFPLPAAGTKLVIKITGTSTAQVVGTTARFNRTVPRAKKVVKKKSR
ncbi:MAG TPA: PKD domain-containing protein [Baekduia sp.]|uniref:PKD domain-containing protein n=1 Tax=Baekduia sp. TaxID=2600305 RepID=UPI002C863F2F|nr:PKD domain-containing protein [Baekduia sp.]HMJ32435.1 PKD domain-containing protein [Baekduia sp.]